jgi:hypothetical protein
VYTSTVEVGVVAIRGGRLSISTQPKGDQLTKVHDEGRGGRGGVKEGESREKERERGLSRGTNGRRGRR